MIGLLREPRVFSQNLVRDIKLSNYGDLPILGDRAQGYSQT